MTNQVPDHAGTPEAPFSKEWLAQLRKGLGNVNGKPALMSGFSVTGDQIRQIQEAISRLKARLLPGQDDIRAKAVLIARLISGFPAQQGDPELKADAYFFAFEGLPVWAVERGVRLVNRGEAGLDTRFCPTPAQMSVLVRKMVKPVRDDLATLERLNTAAVDREIPVDEHKRVSAGFDRLLAELTPQRNREKTVAQARAALEDICREDGIDPALIDKVPDQPERTGTWSKLSGGMRR